MGLSQERSNEARVVGCRLLILVDMSTIYDTRYDEASYVTESDNSVSKSKYW
jgi:hypothetical protein